MWVARFIRGVSATIGTLLRTRSGALGGFLKRTSRKQLPSAFRALLGVALIANNFIGFKWSFTGLNKMVEVVFFSRVLKVSLGEHTIIYSINAIKSQSGYGLFDYAD